MRWTLVCSTGILKAESPGAQNICPHRCFLLGSADIVARLDFEDVRKVAITAFFSDDHLMEKLVLKGGNALTLIYRCSTRTSLDLDFSIDGDLTDIADAQSRIFRALRDRFDSAGFVLFDELFRPKPAVLGPDQPPSWGGYEVEFKLIEKSQFEDLHGNLENIRRQSLVIGPGQKRTFTVDLSKHEYCENKKEVELDHYTIYVYTPEMLVVEKLRAICQQMDEYPHRRRPGLPRARDFYDIHALLTTTGVNITKDLNLIRHIFSAKEVPFQLLSLVKSQREFHRPDWPAVVQSVGQPI